VLPPIGKQKHYPALDLTVIHANERGTPKGRKPIEWKLITDLPVRKRRRDRQDQLVRHAVENRGVLQSPEVGLQGGRRKTAYGGASCQPAKQTFIGCPTNVCLDSFVFAEFFHKTGKATFANTA
jgi:hypothetical protein